MARIDSRFASARRSSRFDDVSRTTTAWSAQLAVRPSAVVELSLFGWLPVDRTLDVPVAGLAVRFDVALHRVGTAVPPSEPDVRDLRPDEAVADWKQAAVAGKVTVLELSAAWCSPCHAARGWLMELARRDASLAVRTVDVEDERRAAWVAAFADPTTHAMTLPTFAIFDTEGRSVDVLRGFDETKVLDAIARARTARRSP